MNYIEKVCIDRGIQRLHFECHWMYRKKCEALRERFRQKGITIQLKIGVESFDHEMRENVMVKGMAEDRPEEIARYFDEICLLFGLTGQSLASMEKDIRLGLQYFKRICINLMVENTAPDFYGEPVSTLSGQSPCGYFTEQYRFWRRRRERCRMKFYCCCRL